MNCVLIVGNVGDGVVEVYGPFGDEDDALSYAMNELEFTDSRESWTVRDLTQPR